MTEARDARRDVLRKLGLGSVAALMGAATTPRQASANTFAGRFLKHTEPTEVPPGYYDPATQLYHDAASERPMFVCQTAENEEVHELTDQELADLLRSGRFVDVGQLSGKQRPDATWSRQTTLSTTRCCPIVTDTSRDQGPDDPWDPLD